MANGILWQLAGNIDPLGRYNQGLQQHQKQQTILQQLAGQEQDRQFNRERDQRNFGWQQQEAQRNQGNWEKQFGQNAANQNAMRDLQRQQFELQKQTANTAQIVMVEQPDGSKIPVRIDRQGNASPVNTGIQPQQQNPANFVPPGVDAKTWRVERTKDIAKDFGAAPGAIAKADNMLKVIDNVLNDPVLPNATGFYSKLQSVPGIPQFGFGQKVAQLQGQSFLQAFESLKGGGQITQIEGEKATAAIGRLNTAQSAKDFRAALEELKEVVNSARQRQVQLQKQYSPQSQQPNASGGNNAPDPLGIR